MADDLTISMGHKDFSFQFACDAPEVADLMTCPNNNHIAMRLADDLSGNEMKLAFSPRAIATFLFNALLLSPVAVCQRLNEERERLAVSVPLLLADSVSRGCLWPNAWGGEIPEGDFIAHFANPDYELFFQKCGEFDVELLRWRHTGSGVEISDLMVCEHFVTESQWVERQGDFYADKSEDEKHFDYLEDLEENVWPVSYVRLSLKMTHACLIAMLAKAADLSLEYGQDVSDSQNAQQWTDLFATLTMIMTRLPPSLAGVSRKALYSDVAALAANTGKRKWPLPRRTVGKFNKPLPKRYSGFAPAG